MLCCVIVVFCVVQVVCSLCDSCLLRGEVEEHLKNECGGVVEQCAICSLLLNVGDDNGGCDGDDVGDGVTARRRRRGYCCRRDEQQHHMTSCNKEHLLTVMEYLRTEQQQQHQQLQQQLQDQQQEHTTNEQQLRDKLEQQQHQRQQLLQQLQQQKEQQVKLQQQLQDQQEEHTTCELQLRDCIQQLEQQQQQHQQTVNDRIEQLSNEKIQQQQDLLQQLQQQLDRHNDELKQEKGLRQQQQAENDRRWSITSKGDKAALRDLVESLERGKAGPIRNQSIVKRVESLIESSGVKLPTVKITNSLCDTRVVDYSCGDITLSHGNRCTTVHTKEESVLVCCVNHSYQVPLHLPHLPHPSISPLKTTHLDCVGIVHLYDTGVE